MKHFSRQQPLSENIARR